MKMSGKSARILVATMLTSALLLLLACASALAASAPVFSPPVSLAQQSTTGPLPPANVSPPKTVSSLTRSGNVYVDGSATAVPCYYWWDGCGPTAVGMVVGYWDSHGYPLLIPGDPTSQDTNPAVDQAISSHDIGAGAQSYEDYALPREDLQNPPVTVPIDDMSTIDPGGAHTSDCLADFMHTSWSADGNCYGWSYSNMIGLAFFDYVDYVYPACIPKTHDYYWSTGTLTWALVKQQIDSGHPMVFLVDSDGDGHTDHFVPVIGYNGTSHQYACWDTWYDTPRWESFHAMQAGNAWGVYQATTFTLSGSATDTTPPVTTASGGGATWHKSSVTVTLTPHDSGSGMVGGQAGTWYKVDSGSYTAGLTVLVSGDGVHTVQYYSKDYAGNIETAKKCTVNIDSAAPVTSASNTSARHGHMASLRYRVTDLTPKAKVTILIKTLGGATKQTFRLGQQATNKQLTYKFLCTLKKGSYVAVVNAVDLAGNHQATAGSAQLVVK